jgi:predicted site-specific integrase-resolvase
MTEELPTGDEIDIDEAVKLTGLRRETLMRYKRDGKLSGRVALVEQI